MDTAEQRSLQTTLLGSAGLGLFGLVLSMSSDGELGAWMCVVGFVAMGWTLHRFGRTGPD